MNKQEFDSINPITLIPLVEEIITWAFNTIGTAIPIFGWRKHLEQKTDKMIENEAIMAKAIKELQDKAA